MCLGEDEVWGLAVPGDPVWGVVRAQLMGTPAAPPSSAGFVVGHAGLYQALAMFAVAYFIIGMTVLSVCAIATNGALDAGGAYCILCCECCQGRACAPKSGDHPVASGCHAGIVTPLAWEGGVGAPSGGLGCWHLPLTRARYDQPCPGPGVRGKHWDHVFPGQRVWQCPLRAGAGGGGGGQLWDPAW